MNEVLKNIFAFCLPFIAKLIKSTVVPKLKRKAYERLDDFTNDRIEDLGNLVDKIKSETNEVKKEAHLEGFRLGISTLRAMANKLLKACAELEKALA